MRWPRQNKAGPAHYSVSEYILWSSYHARSWKHCSVAQSCLTFCDPWTAACQASLSFTISWSLLKLMSVVSVMPSNHLILVPFSSCLQSFTASASFLMSQFFASGGQSIRASASASVFLMNIQDWFPWGLTGLNSLQSKRLKNLLQHNSLKASIIWCSAFFMVQLSHPYITTGKTIALATNKLNRVPCIQELKETCVPQCS